MFDGANAVTNNRIYHDTLQTTGYNLGMRKGTFATTIDPKEYF